MNGIISLLKETGLPFAYDHFAEGDSPDPPFICFLTEGSDNFSADGSVYLKASEVHLELYTERKDPGTERKVEAVLDRHNVFYNKSESLDRDRKAL